MFNSKALKKMKDSMEINKDMKSMSEYAMKSMKPEMEEEDEEEGEEKESLKKGMGPEAKLEIEIMLQSAKKKKK
jgi:hypothetical protein